MLRYEDGDSGDTHRSGTTDDYGDVGHHGANDAGQQRDADRSITAASSLGDGASAPEALSFSYAQARLRFRN